MSFQSIKEGRWYSSFVNIFTHTFDMQFLIKPKQFKCLISSCLFQNYHEWFFGSVASCRCWFQLPTSNISSRHHTCHLISELIIISNNLVVPNVVEDPFISSYLILWMIFNSHLSNWFRDSRETPVETLFCLIYTEVYLWRRALVLWISLYVLFMNTS